MRKNNSPSIEPWGTPALTGNQLDVWPFNKTRWDLLSRKFLMSFKKLPDIPVNFNLQISAACHALSKAFDVSKNIPCVSKTGLLSKTMYISQTVASK